MKFIITYLIAILFSFLTIGNSCYASVGSPSLEKGKSSKKTFKAANQIDQLDVLFDIEEEEEDEKHKKWLMASIYSYCYHLHFQPNFIALDSFYFAKFILPLTPKFILLEVFRL